MSPVAVGMMILICGFVWGGFTGFLILAVRREGRKRQMAGLVR